PVEKQIQKNRSLYVVPGKVLNYLPFGALVSPDSGNFLIADYSVTVAPSSSLFVACTEMAHAKEGARAERLLSIGNPRFDRRAFPFISDLPSASEEAKKVAAYYEPTMSSVLTGKAATEGRTKHEMLRSDVIHF